MHRFSVFILTFCLLGVLLVGCTNHERPELPGGEQTVSGILKPAEISVSRRGSHLIEEDGIDQYFAESAVVNLRAFQGKQVTLRGILEHNIDASDLPVLVVDTIVDVEETIKEYHFRTLKLSLSAPVNWGVSEELDQVQFSLEGVEEPILTIFQEAGEALPEGGVPVVVDATRATRLVDEFSGNQIVAVQRNEQTVLTFLFSPGQAMNPAALRDAWVTLLSSVTFDASASSGGPLSGTGALGSPCGGAAGILCPEGYFCDVEDLEENIGRCRKI